MSFSRENNFIFIDLPKNAKPRVIPKPKHPTHDERLKEYRANLPRNQEIKRWNEMRNDLIKLGKAKEKVDPEKIKKLTEECQTLYETLFAVRIKNRAEKKQKLKEEQEKAKEVEAGNSNEEEAGNSNTNS